MCIVVAAAAIVVAAVLVIVSNNAWIGGLSIRPMNSLSVWNKTDNSDFERGNTNCWRDILLTFESRLIYFKTVL